MTATSEARPRARSSPIVSVVLSTLAQQSYEQLHAFFHKKRHHTDKILPFFSMVEKHKIMHRETMQTLRAWDSRLWGTPLYGRLPPSGIMRQHQALTGL